MNEITCKKPHIILLSVIWMILLFTGGVTQLGNAQTNLQELQSRVAELERKLADAKARQEKAYGIQMKLEEQEQKLANLANSDKYKIQIIEIRADIKNIRTRIEAITKEKNDLEENLRLARNLQTILSEAQTIAKPDTKTQAAPVQEKRSTQAERIATAKTSIKMTVADIESRSSWLIENIQISNHFTDNERSEILNNFSSGRQINQDDLLKSAYQIYNRTGISLRLVIHPKSGNTADLEILLDQREGSANAKNSDYIAPMTFSQFKSERFIVTVAK